MKEIKEPKEKKPYKNYGQVDFTEHEIELVEEQSKKDMKSFGVELK